MANFFFIWGDSPPCPHEFCPCTSEVEQSDGYCIDSSKTNLQAELHIEYTTTLSLNFLISAILSFNILINFTLIKSLYCVMC